VTQTCGRGVLEIGIVKFSSRWKWFFQLTLDHFAPEIGPHCPFIGAYMDPTEGLNPVENSRISCLCRESSDIFWVFQLLVTVAVLTERLLLLICRYKKFRKFQEFWVGFVNRMDTVSHMSQYHTWQYSICVLQRVTKGLPPEQDRMLHGYHPKRKCPGMSLGPQVKQENPVTPLW
jgi:hypothetical protein